MSLEEILETFGVCKACNTKYNELVLTEHAPCSECANKKLFFYCVQCKQSRYSSDHPNKTVGNCGAHENAITTCDLTVSGKLFKDLPLVGLTAAKIIDIYSNSIKETQVSQYQLKAGTFEPTESATIVDYFNTNVVDNTLLVADFFENFPDKTLRVGNILNGGGTLLCNGEEVAFDRLLWTIPETSAVEFTIRHANVDFSPRTSKKRDRTEEHDGMDATESVPKSLKPTFVAGQSLEAENEWPMYKNTIHEVIYIEEDPENPGYHKCMVPAFDDGDNIFSFSADHLHVPRTSVGEEDKTFIAHENVHVRVRNRHGFNEKGKYRTKLDGHDSKKGVWVKARIDSCLPNNTYSVCYPTWDLRYETPPTIIVSNICANDIRKAYSKVENS